MIMLEYGIWTMATFLRAFIIFIFFDDGYSAVMTHVAVRQVNYQNFIINSATTVPPIRSRVECVQKCVSMVSCMSVFYHITARTCHRVPMGYITDPTDVGVPDIGWSYYIILEGKLFMYCGT